MPVVLVIDDDIEPMKYYVMALEKSGFDVVQKRDPDEAIDYLAGSDDPEPNIVILDIMIPPGKRYAHNPECDKGLRTGLLLYPELRRFCRETPFIVLTNLRNPQTMDDFKNVAPDVPTYEKNLTPPFELVDIVNEMLERSHSP